MSSFRHFFRKGLPGAEVDNDAGEDSTDCKNNENVDRRCAADIDTQQHRNRAGVTTCIGPQ